MRLQIICDGTPFEALPSKAPITYNTLHVGWLNRTYPAHTWELRRIQSVKVTRG